MEQAILLRSCETLTDLFSIEITFAPGFEGKKFTVTNGSDFTVTETVPESRAISVAVPYPNTHYTIICDGIMGTAKTGMYFGIYSVPFPVAFSNFSWAQIAAVAEVGWAESVFQIGDERDIKLFTGEILTLQIYGFNHDDLSDGSGKAGITFGLKNLMASIREMNSSNTNSFTDSPMYSWLQGDLYSWLPSDLRGVIKSVKKKTSAGNKSPTINTNDMKIFLFSEVECFGTTTYSYSGEGSKYPIFIDDTSRTKYLSNGSGSASYWLERSPRENDAVRFTAVTERGTVYYSTAATGQGVCFGFCI